MAITALRGDKISQKGTFSVETLGHFNCPHCSKWWSIGDPDPRKRQWFCPWCGKKIIFELSEVSSPAEKAPDSAGNP